MGVHEELQNLDPDVWAQAIANVITRLALQPERIGQGMVTTQNKAYRLLNEAPNILGEVIGEAAPEKCEDTLEHLTSGARLMSAVVSEYAQLVLHAEILPDMPNLQPPEA